MSDLDIQHIEELLQYSQKLSKDCKILYDTNAKDDSYLFSIFPNYTENVNDFFSLVSKDFWVDENYLTNTSYEQLMDDKFIFTATLTQLKSLLTFCNRGERFCTGHWYEVIKSGRIKLILERLSILRMEILKQKEE